MAEHLSKSSIVSQPPVTVIFVLVVFQLVLATMPPASAITYPNRAICWLGGFPSSGGYEEVLIVFPLGVNASLLAVACEPHVGLVRLS